MISFMVQGHIFIYLELNSYKLKLSKSLSFVF